MPELFGEDKYSPQTTNCTGRFSAGREIRRILQEESKQGRMLCPLGHCPNNSVMVNRVRCGWPQGTEHSLFPLWR